MNEVTKLNTWLDKMGMKDLTIDENKRGSKLGKFFKDRNNELRRNKGNMFLKADDCSTFQDSTEVLRILLEDEIEDSNKNFEIKLITEIKTEYHGCDRVQEGDKLYYYIINLPVSQHGGKKIKYFRKHKGINQNTGKLNKGYKYSGKKLKSGISEIKKIS